MGCGDGTAVGQILPDIFHTIPNLSHHSSKAEVSTRSPLYRLYSYRDHSFFGCIVWGDWGTAGFISGTSDVYLPVSGSLVAYRLPYGAIRTSGGRILAAGKLWFWVPEIMRDMVWTCWGNIIAFGKRHIPITKKKWYYLYVHLGNNLMMIIIIVHINDDTCGVSWPIIRCIVIDLMSLCCSNHDTLPVLGTFLSSKMTINAQERYISYHDYTSTFFLYDKRNKLKLDCIDRYVESRWIRDKRKKERMNEWITKRISDPRHPRILYHW